MYKLTLRSRYNYLQKDGMIKEVYIFSMYIPEAEDPAYNVKKRYADELFRRRLKEAIPDLNDDTEISFGFIGADILIDRVTVKVVI